MGPPPPRAQRALLAALLLCVALVPALAHARGLKQATSCVITSPAAGTSVAAGSSLTVQVAAAGTLARVDLFLAATSAGAGCKMLEIPASSPGQTAFSGAVPLPAAARGALWVYAKAVPTSSSFPILKSAYVAVDVTGAGAGGNIPPYIKLAAPTAGASYTAPTTIAAAATACDLDGAITKVDFYKNSTLYATSTAVPFVGSLSVASAGALSFYATATDSQGATSTTAAVAINVVAGGGGGGGGGGSTWTLIVQGGSGGGTWPQYTWVNISAAPPPPGQVFAGWTTTCSPCPQLQHTDTAHYVEQVYSRSIGAATLTATYKVDAPIPTPVPSHPRLLVTAAQLPQLQAWAVNSNPMYLNGFRPALSYALGRANMAWSWSFAGGTGTPNLALWSDTGGDSWEGDHTEAYAMFLAFSSLIHNDITHAQRAKDMLMWVIRAAVANAPTNAGPFGSQFFATYNRASHYGDGFGATYDWLQWWGPTFFSAAEKALIQKAFLTWAKAAVTGYMHPGPVGVVNNPQLLSGARGVANNYASAHMRQLAYYALSFDAADDPVADAKLPEAYLGNTLRSYISNVAGAWLYQKFAIMEDPATVAAAFGVPITSPNLGSMSGGLSPEGFLYGSSMAYVMQTLMALQTSGWGTVAASGPQMALIDSAWWDKFLAGYLSSIVTTPFNAGGSSAYMGQVWQMHNYGDSLRLYIDPPQFDTFGMLGWYDKAKGSQRYKTSAWIGANVMLGGMGQLYQRASSIWGNCYARAGILHFLLYDPSYQAAALPDPRISAPLPLTFLDASLGRVVSRTTWGPGGSSFAYKCSWEAINHMLADCGQFELWRNGAWLTKENTGYATDASEVIGGSSVLHQTLAIQNTVSDPTLAYPVSMQPDEVTLFSLGSQQAEGYLNAGDPNTTISDAPGYTSVHSSFGSLYNRPSAFNPQNAAVDVLHASRTLLWVKPSAANGGVDTIITYDRATTIHSGKFKRWHMNWVTQPVRNGNVLTATAGPNSLQLTSLLPAGANITTVPIPPWHNPAEMEPSTIYTIVQDDALPSDVRFLHVLQASDSSSPATPPAALLTGAVNGGAPGGAHGALVGARIAALFVRDLPPAAPAVNSLTFSLPAGAARPAEVYVTGLVPQAAYSLSVDGSTGVYTLAVGGAGAVTADASGLAVF